MYKPLSKRWDKSKCVNKSLESARCKIRVLRAWVQPDPMWRAAALRFISTSTNLSTFYREFDPHEWNHWASKLIPEMQVILEYTPFSQAFLKFKKKKKSWKFSTTSFLPTKIGQGWLKLYRMVEPASTGFFELSRLRRHWISLSITGDGHKCWF